MVAAWVLIALSLVGLAINLYFVSLLYPVPAWFSRALGGAARACGIDGGACKRVVQTPYARLFAGRPNIVAGLPWSLLTLACATVFLATGAFPLWWPCVFIAFASVVVGVYLTWVLFVVLKEPCPL
jgi:uncharacterized membrane protein